LSSCSGLSDEYPGRKSYIASQYPVLAEGTLCVESLIPINETHRDLSCKYT